MRKRVIDIGDVKGLSEADITLLQQQFGKNVLKKRRSQFWQILLNVIKEPMFLLLVLACTLYFVLGQNSEGLLMLTAVIFVTAISIFQDIRSTRALAALKAYTEAFVTVIRDGLQKSIRAEDLVPGDTILLEEGNRVPADAIILKANDLSVNESIITGESLPVDKDPSPGQNQLFHGSTINSGSCYAQVTHTGDNTSLGRLGKSINAYSVSHTLLQTQVNRFVKWLAIFGIMAFLVIWFINYTQSNQLAQSLLLGLTLAMAAIPEEIPVAFSSFMALGAYRMSKLGIISRQPQTIENLGAVHVLCLDKTGTITENKMTVQSLYDFENDQLVSPDSLKNTTILGFAMLASEQEPFDEMEKAIHEAYSLYAKDSPFEKWRQIYEYPLTGKPPMMTHVYEHNHEKIIAGKGAPERIIRVCGISGSTAEKVNHYITSQAQKGYRVIGVASAIHSKGNLPVQQDDFNWQFHGFISMYDPPRPNVEDALKKLYTAGIQIKLLTGDHAETAMNVARQTGFSGWQKYTTGNQVMNTSGNALNELVKDSVLFVRMFPEAKERAINTLKSNGYIVAMTGDGVNDAPALKAADIGIAMGKKGTEIARLAADLVITDDDLEKLPQAVQQGRTVFSNLKKAVGYIIAIHIPIICTASLPLLLGWQYANIFTPIHIIFLELIMGPTCSVFFEREPADERVMLTPPRHKQASLFRRDELLIYMLQGVTITLGTLWIFHSTMSGGASLEATRTLVFTTLIFSNLFLTFSNRSFNETIIRTIRYGNNLAPWVLLLSVLFLSMILLVPPVRSLFGLVAISSNSLMLCISIALASVGWFEVYKASHTKTTMPVPQNN
jgi:ATPase, P-type (transporting), HAD superfamily, subfamily IC